MQLVRCFWESRTPLRDKEKREHCNVAFVDFPFGDLMCSRTVLYVGTTACSASKLCIILGTHFGVLGEDPNRMRALSFHAFNLSRSK
mmetsp:Transcript_14860/g.60442  ORF Transcript_14860/g.60442 Transcript_14860/m.60442 type:complete len:87 (+) Transcript_14860:329-589(+)